MTDWTLWLYLLGLPATMLAAVTLLGRRYRRAVQASMMRRGASVAVPAPAPVQPLRADTRPLLRIETLAADDHPTLQGEAAIAFEHALHATRRYERCFLLAGGMFWAAMVALQVLSVPANAHATSLWLWALWAALPGAVVLVSAVARSWRSRLRAAAAYGVVLLVSVGALAWHFGDVPRALGAAASLASLYLPPAVAVLLLMQARLRALVVAVVPVLLFLAVGGAAVMWAMGAGILPPDLDQLKPRTDMRWPAPVMYGLGLAVVPLGAWLFLRIMRGHRKPEAIGALAAIGIAGAAIDNWTQPGFPLGPLANALPSAVLQCFVVWLLFKTTVATEGRGWMSTQALQFHLCWAVLALYAMWLLEPSSRVAAWVAMVAYAALLFGLLRRARMSQQSHAPKRLLFLRVFGNTNRSERVMDTLDDTWRRIGRVDLIAGTDLATRTLGSWMLECFLLQRVDAEFLRSATDVERRLSRLRTRLEGDLRFPVNEVFCYADTWSLAVMQLAQGSDAVLLDLRGFQRDNLGCAFELTHLVWQVPLDRVVVLCDGTTDMAALRAVADAAWAGLPGSSPNASTAEPVLAVLRIGSAAALDPVARALFRVAFSVA
ncbi:hypothetical protein ASF43_09285 [Pseudorhodoferax sp. Leaf267]|nr:hypothetical protein ASF43_09285 [Pseudorhodoferax sp. Leaf267]